MPIVAVTTRGASGKLRKNPVMRVTDGSAYAVVASKSGSDEHRASKSHRHRQLTRTNAGAARGRTGFRR
jgi:hypothetical protein